MLGLGGVSQISPLWSFYFSISLTVFIRNESLGPANNQGRGVSSTSWKEEYQSTITKVLINKYLGRDTLWSTNILVLHKVLPLILALSHGYCQWQSLLWYLKSDFPLSSFLSHSSSKWKPFSSPNLFILLFIYITVDLWMFILLF